MGTEKKGMPRNPALERNEHLRNLDLASHQRAPVDPRGHWVGDGDAVDAWPARFHRTRLGQEGGSGLYFCCSLAAATIRLIVE